MHQFAHLPDALGLNNIIYIFPNAPYPDGTVDDGDEESGFTWRAPGEQGGVSPNAVREFIDNIATRYGPGIRMFVGGFSQGAACALYCGLGSDFNVAGILAVSGWLVAAVDPSKIRECAPPIFWAHGLYDRVLPVEIGRECSRLLESHGHRVTYREYPIGHEIALAIIRDMRAWLRYRLQ